MRYTVQAVEPNPENLGEYRAVGELESYSTTEDARRAVKRAYLRTGSIPAVFNESGKAATLLTNEEVAKWGLETPELL